MRNLKCIQQAQYKFEADLPCCASTWDIVGNAIIYALGPSESNPLIELRRVSTKPGDDHNSDLIASWDAPSPLPEIVVDEVLYLHHLVSSEITCLVLAGGDIIIVRHEPLSDQEKIEIVGSVDVGISAASWSPDEDLLAITTRGNTLLFMTTSFDNTVSISFSAGDAELSKQVSVGWGKRETQFQGKRTKALRDPTVPERVDEGILSENDDGRVHISWRGDGAFLAVNTIEPQGRRMVRIFSREGTIDSVSETVDGLEGTVAWKPSGQLIAGVKRHEEDTQVVFFERNGLRHGDFSLRLSTKDSQSWASRIQLAWNVDSTTLMVSFLDRIQFWTMENYHYYLKQEIFFQQSSDSRPLQAKWHPEEPLRVLVREGGSEAEGSALSEIGYGDQKLHENKHSSIRFDYTLSEHPTVSPNDLGTVVVIDGRKLRVSPLRTANIPPPLALFEIDLPENAIDVAVSPNNKYVCVLHHTSVSIYTLDLETVDTHQPVMANEISLPSTKDLKPAQLTVKSVHEILVLFYDLPSNKCSVFSTHLKKFCYATDYENANTLLFNSLSPTSLLLESCRLTQLGSVAEGHNLNGADLAKLPFTFPNNVINAKVWNSQDLAIGFGLTATGTLYANEKTLMRNCTSFLLTDSHVILTTSNHLLKFIHISTTLDLEIPPDEPEKDERCRNVEIGARLVSILPSTCAVVLQMPRGNLETIYPRALVLAGIRQSIDREQYKKAFLACRKHRVDMNILHDYKPDQFLKNISLVINQLNKIEYIDLFLSQLIDQDVSETLYRNTLPKKAVNGPSKTSANTSIPRANDPNEDARDSSKVNRICNAFLNTLRTKQEGCVQNMITANVCKNPPDIEAGLSLILSLGDLESETVESAVEHACFLTDVNMIYDTALGIYNLKLALAVAQQSQKDPREYLPYLQSLDSLPMPKRRFQIDDDLKRYSKALNHLHEYADIDTILAFTQRHELYKEALEVNKYQKSNYSQVMRSYAEFLSLHNRFKEAAIAFESLSDYASASTAYSSAQMWRESLSCATLANLSPAAIATLSQSLTDTLLESKSYYDAATILSQHLSDVPQAARTFCKGYHFADAIRLLALNDCKDLFSDIIDAGLAEGFSSLTEFISECKGQLQAQVPRLRELREKKMRDPLAFFEGVPEVGQPGADIPDNISLAPSETTTAGGTLLTRYTGRMTGTVATGGTRRTSKNRRREERKRARGKKGSVYEEEYLMNSVSRLIERVNETGEDVHRTVETLCRRAMWERAKALETGFKELVAACERCVLEVWDDESETEKPADEERPGERPMGADGILWDSIEEARKGRTAPNIKPFAGSSLLGS